MSAHSTTLKRELLPTGADGVSVTASGSSFGNSAWVQITAGELTDIDLLALVALLNTSAPVEVDVGIGAAAAEVVLTTFRFFKGASSGWHAEIPHVVPIRILAGTRVSVRMRISGTAGLAHRYKISFLRNP